MTRSVCRARKGQTPGPILNTVPQRHNLDWSTCGARLCWVVYVWSPQRSRDGSKRKRFYAQPLAGRACAQSGLYAVRMWKGLTSRGGRQRWSRKSNPSCPLYGAVCSMGHGYAHCISFSTSSIGLEACDEPVDAPAVCPIQCHGQGNLAITTSRAGA